MNTSRLRTALGLAFIAMISGTMPLTATATQPHPPSTKPSVQVGPTAIYRYPTDTPGAGLIDKDGSFHVQHVCGPVWRQRRARVGLPDGEHL